MDTLACPDSFWRIVRTSMRLKGHGQHDPHLVVTIYKGTSDTLWWDSGMLPVDSAKLDTNYYLKTHLLARIDRYDITGPQNIVFAKLLDDNNIPIVSNYPGQLQTFVGAGDSLVLETWAGEGTYGSPGETLAEPRCRTIWARLRTPEPGLGAGINGESISWECIAAHGTLSHAASVTGTHTVWPTGSSSPPAYYDGMASVNLYLSPAYVGQCTVHAYVSSHPTYCTDFIIHSVEGDRDTVPDTLDLYEKVLSVWPPLRGDGLWQGDDPDTLAANLYVEVDFDPVAISEADLPDVDAKVRHVYQSIGIVCSLRVHEKNLDLRQYDRQSMKGTLAFHRNAAWKGIGKGYLHAVIGGCCYDTVNGKPVYAKNVCYDDPHSDDFIDRTLAAHRSIPEQCPGGHRSNPYLDSCGILIFANFLEEQTPHWSRSEKAALMIEHEIGHALGLADFRLTPYSVMYSPIDVDKYYSDYAKFVQNQEDHRINLRRLLGREKIQVYWINDRIP